MNQSVQYEYWSEFLYREGAECSPAGLHGLLCGLLTGAEAPSVSAWLDLAAGFMNCPSEPQGSAKDALAAMYELSLRNLQDDQLSWQLLLPDDALPLAERTRALSHWCSGYLQGYDRSNTDAETLPSAESAHHSEVSEVLADLSEIALLEDAPEESNTNEAYFAELSEYVRVAVINLFLQAHPDALPDAQSANFH